MQTLEFIKPKAARPQDGAHGRGDLVRPVFNDEHGGLGEQRLKGLRHETTWRNLIAWYLKAAGISTDEIATHLSLSQSRVNSLATKARKQFFDFPWSVQVAKFSAKRDELHAQQAAAHVLRARRAEMQMAEHCLYLSSKSDLFVVSASLELGRRAYETALAATAGERCSCHLCRFPHITLEPYWKDV